MLILRLNLGLLVTFVLGLERRNLELGDLNQSGFVIGFPLIGSIIQLCILPFLYDSPSSLEWNSKNFKIKKYLTLNSSQNSVINLICPKKLPNSMAWRTKRYLVMKNRAERIQYFNFYARKAFWNPCLLDVWCKLFNKLQDLYWIFNRTAPF